MNEKKTKRIIGTLSGIGIGVIGIYILDSTSVLQKA